jgi:hypothetical protein
VLSLFCTRGCGRIARPAFRAPSHKEGDDVNHSLFAFARTGLIPRALDVETRRENAQACRVASEVQIRADASATGESWIAASMISLRRHAIRSIVSVVARAFKISRNEMRKMPCSQ